MVYAALLHFNFHIHSIIHTYFLIKSSWTLSQDSYHTQILQTQIGAIVYSVLLLIEHDSKPYLKYLDQLSALNVFYNIASILKISLAAVI